MKPLAWSHTALDDFKNCPRSFYEKRVAKSVKEERSEQMIWGEKVHRAFEERQGLWRALPPGLEEHEPFMKALQTLPGNHDVEIRIGFNKQGKPCNWEVQDIWYRGIIDYLKVHKDQALIVDYKTGKPHSKFQQLYLFAIHTFLMYPDVHRVKVMYYWTQTLSTTHEYIARDRVPELWATFLPDLKQYAQAFKEDTWQPRPSGLCSGWCPVTTCEHWKPKRKK